MHLKVQRDILQLRAKNKVWPQGFHVKNETVRLELMRENRQTKIKLILNCEMVRQGLISGNTETIIAHFRTKTAVNLEDNDDADELRMFLEPMEEGIFNFNQRGSNWRFQRVVDLEIDLAEYDPTGGSSYIQLPKQLNGKKAIINMKDEDK